MKFVETFVVDLCNEAHSYISKYGGNNFKDMYNNCERGDWLCYMIYRLLLYCKRRNLEYYDEINNILLDIHSFKEYDELSRMLKICWGLEYKKVRCYCYNVPHNMVEKENKELVNAIRIKYNYNYIMNLMKRCKVII